PSLCLDGSVPVGGSAALIAAEIPGNGRDTNGSPPDLGLHGPLVHVLPLLDRPGAQLADQLHQPLDGGLEQNAALLSARFGRIAMDSGLRPAAPVIAEADRVV